MKDTEINEKTGTKKTTTIIVILLLISSIMYALVEGSQKVTLVEIWNVLNGNASDINQTIILNLRMPRIIIGFIVGICLGISGMMLQGTMRNPLADPGIIGVSAGAALSAVVILMLFPQLSYLLPFFTFFGGIVTVIIVYFLALKNGASPTKIILSGVAINSLIGAVTSALMLLYSDRVQAILPWMSGGIGGANWYQVKLVGPYVFFGVILALLGIPHLKVLLLGDDVAKLLGHNVARSRLYLIGVSAFLAGLAVSVSGLIGFVGLVVPHILRLIIGHDYKYLVPLSGIGGAALVIFADTAGRSWFNPIELQVGILLAIIGGPFFLYLLQKGGTENGKHS